MTFGVNTFFAFDQVVVNVATCASSSLSTISSSSLVSPLSSTGIPDTNNVWIHAVSWSFGVPAGTNNGPPT